jgi:DNA-binding PadR family transcriptional regulator
MFLVNIFRANIKPGDLGAVTSIEFEILLSLAGGERHGYAIIQDIGERSGGAATVRPGTLYRAIARLLDARLIEEVAARAGEEDERRRYCRITRLGRQLAAVESERLARQVETARARKLLKTRA